MKKSQVAITMAMTIMAAASSISVASAESFIVNTKSAVETSGAALNSMSESNYNKDKIVYLYGKRLDLDTWRQADIKDIIKEIEACDLGFNGFEETYDKETLVTGKWFTAEEVYDKFKNACTDDMVETKMYFGPSVDTIIGALVYQPSQGEWLSLELNLSDDVHEVIHITEDKLSGADIIAAGLTAFGDNKMFEGQSDSYYSIMQDFDSMTVYLNLGFRPDEDLEYCYIMEGYNFE